MKIFKNSEKQNTNLMTAKNEQIKLKRLWTNSDQHNKNLWFCTFPHIIIHPFLTKTLHQNSFDPPNRKTVKDRESLYNLNNSLFHDTNFSTYVIPCHFKMPLLKWHFVPFVKIYIISLICIFILCWSAEDWAFRKSGKLYGISYAE